MIGWLFHALREVVAWVLGTLAVLCLVPFILFFLSCFLVDRRTAERYARGLAGAWKR